MTGRSCVGKLPSGCSFSGVSGSSVIVALLALLSGLIHHRAEAGILTLLDQRVELIGSLIQRATLLLFGLAGATVEVSEESPFSNTSFSDSSGILISHYLAEGRVVPHFVEPLVGLFVELRGVASWALRLDEVVVAP
jgi:hypothetical protein